MKLCHLVLWHSHLEILWSTFTEFSITLPFHFLTSLRNKYWNLKIIFCVQYSWQNSSKGKPFFCLIRFWFWQYFCNHYWWQICFKMVINGFYCDVRVDFISRICSILLMFLFFTFSNYLVNLINSAWKFHWKKNHKLNLLAFVMAWALHWRCLNPYGIWRAPCLYSICK